MEWWSKVWWFECEPEELVPNHNTPARRSYEASFTLIEPNSTEEARYLCSVGTEQGAVQQCCCVWASQQWRALKGRDMLAKAGESPARQRHAGQGWRRKLQSWLHAAKGLLWLYGEHWLYRCGYLLENVLFCLSKCVGTLFSSKYGKCHYYIWVIHGVRWTPFLLLKPYEILIMIKYLTWSGLER